MTPDTQPKQEDKSVLGDLYINKVICAFHACSTLHTSANGSSRLSVAVTVS
jgi:hypothetical protein